MAAVHVVRPGFIAELKLRFGSGYTARYDAKKQRYVVTTPSTRGVPVDQVWGWFYDPTRSTWNVHTKAFEHPPIPVDEESGLPPFRELDAQAEREILEAMDKTYLHNRHDGTASWAERSRVTQEHNRTVYQRGVRQNAQDYATMVSEMDLRRPWLKHHSGSKVGRRIARSV